MFPNSLFITNVELLNVSNSDWIMDSTLSKYMGANRNPSKLKQITAKNCPNLSQETKDKLIAAYPTITFIF
ncbi:MAG: hypothetical protein JWO53_1192 [Chlamydiia bacterium]|nr:hypothetical protein [Chlamydiia bacterium]